MTLPLTIALFATFVLAGTAKLLDEVFEEEVLALGGLIAVHPVDDDIVWRLVKTLGAIRCKALRRLEEKPATEVSLKPHPAIQDFLLTLKVA